MQTHLRDRVPGMLVLSGILTAMSLALSLIDTSLSSILAFIPGTKLGLANIVSMYAIYYMGMPWAFAISAVRCFLGAVFAGQVSMFLFSILGAFGSILVMSALRGKISVIKVSTSGGVMHNMMQLAAAGMITATPSLTYYLPVLMLIGTVSGFLMGIICRSVFRRLPEPKVGTHYRN